MEEIKGLVKECLSIIPNATAKDNEINMLIQSAIKDMERVGINAQENLTNELVRCAIIMYVKSYFGNTNIKEKELCQKSYSFFISSLSSSEEYMKGTINHD